MLLKIYPNESLLKKTIEIQKDQIKAQWVFNQIMEMKTIMRREGGIGIAANQLGFNSSIIIVENTVMINPLIEENWGDLEKDIEGCLSIPNKLFEVERVNGLFVSYLDENGISCKENMCGLRARIFQHELDHLNGITLENNWQSKEIKQAIY